jgi:hypothetical protein
MRVYSVKVFSQHSWADENVLYKPVCLARVARMMGMYFL